MREHALPTGAIHLVFFLTNAPLSLYILVQDGDRVDAQPIVESRQSESGAKQKSWSG